MRRICQSLLNSGVSFVLGRLNQLGPAVSCVASQPQILRLKPSAGEVEFGGKFRVTMM